MMSEYKIVNVNIFNREPIAATADVIRMGSTALLAPVAEHLYGENPLVKEAYCLLYHPQWNSCSDK